MKKIIILHKNLGIGGVETSLLCFVKTMSKYADIKLITWAQGDQDATININKEIFDKNLSYMESVAYLSKNNFSKLKLKNKIKFLFYKVLLKLGRFKKYIFKKIRKVKKKYEADIGICFAPWEISLEIYKQKFNCKQNICFIHGDVSKYKCVPNPKENLKYFDKILCVSKSCAQNFKEVYPDFADKVEYVYNMQDVKQILEKAKEKKVAYGKNFNIVSVSRLSEEKAYIRSLKVLKNLHEKGHHFTWNIVGDGAERGNIEEFIKINNMSEYIVIHGSKKNPYPYIKWSDILYLGSYNEAAPMVYAEAMILGVPVFSTKTCSAEEIVGEFGFVCDNEEESILEMFEMIFNNPRILEEKRKKLQYYKFSNKNTEEKLKKIMNL